tara:strand:- start:16 stop:642 length:627 start_codon:yes stop_codon:yes gene_type:complete
METSGGISFKKKKDLMAFWKAINSKRYELDMGLHAFALLLYEDVYKIKTKKEWAAYLNRFQGRGFKNFYDLLKVLEMNRLISRLSYVKIKKYFDETTSEDRRTVLEMLKLSSVSNNSIMDRVFLPTEDTLKKVKKPKKPRKLGGTSFEVSSVYIGLNYEGLELSFSGDWDGFQDHALGEWIYSNYKKYNGVDNINLRSEYEPDDWGGW